MAYHVMLVFVCICMLDDEYSSFFLRDSKASETQVRVKITHARKARRGGESRLAFLAWGDFHARSRFACSTIPEEKW